MSDADETHHTEDYYENDGRAVRIDTGYYEIQVWGDTDDSFADVMEKAERAADRAKDDVEDLNSQLDGDGKHYS